MSVYFFLTVYSSGVEADYLEEKKQDEDVRCCMPALASVLFNMPSRWEKATRTCPSISDLHVHRAEWTAYEHPPSRLCHEVTFREPFPGSRTDVVKDGRMPASVTATHPLRHGCHGAIRERGGLSLKLGAHSYKYIHRTRQSTESGGVRFTSLETWHR